MTRVYLSPTATLFAKIGLLIIECLIGLYNIVTFPIRKITLKAYSFIILGSGVLYAISYFSDPKIHLVAFLAVLFVFSVAVVSCKAIYNILNDGIGNKIAYMINSPCGIETNRFYKVVY